jgi:hypothetical protein
MTLHGISPEPNLACVSRLLSALDQFCAADPDSSQHVVKPVCWLG